MWKKWLKNSALVFNKQFAVDKCCKNTIEMILALFKQRTHLLFFVISLRANLSYDQGMVEKWLLEVEANMIMSVKQEMYKSYKAYAETPRKKWVLEWPGQIVLCISQTYWTSEVAEAIEEGSLDVRLYWNYR